MDQTKKHSIIDIMLKEIEKATTEELKQAYVVICKQAIEIEMEERENEHKINV